MKNEVPRAWALAIRLIWYELLLQSCLAKINMYKLVRYILYVKLSSSGTGSESAVRTKQGSGGYQGVAPQHGTRLRCKSFPVTRQLLLLQIFNQSRWRIREWNPMNITRKLWCKGGNQETIQVLDTQGLISRIRLSPLDHYYNVMVSDCSLGCRY